MMTEIVRARSSLTPYFNDVRERTPYQFKRHAIQNCLYGVDIDAGAVEIARLRLWLSLVVDEEEVKQIKPLPNLSYKIVAGNSLLGIDKTLFNEKLFRHVEELKPVYFEETDPGKKLELRRKIDHAIHQLTAGKEVFDYEIYFSEVFHAQGGFDVVIANPPYLSAVQFAARYPDTYRTLPNARFETAKGAYDIYVLFMEEGLRLLGRRGVLCFINPNKYLSASYAVALREYVLTNAFLEKLLDVSGIVVFQEASVYPVVSVMVKAPGVSNEVRLVLPQVRETQEFDLRNFVETSVPAKLLRFLPENIWGFLLSTKINVLTRLMQDTSILASVSSINASSTAAEADSYGSHIQTQSTKDSLRLVNTGTIERFVSLWGIEKLTHKGNRFLTPYLPMGRAGVSARLRELYGAPKLVFAKMAKRCEALFDREGKYASLNTNCLYSMRDGTSLDFVAGYCNSRLFMFIYDQFFGALRMSGGYYQFQAPQLRVIPYKKPDRVTERAVSGLVDQILVAKHRDPGVDTTHLEGEIDRLLYKLYGLTPAEIKLVEESTAG